MRLLAVLALVAGEFDVTIHATAMNAPRVRTELPGGTCRVGPERAFERTVRAALKPGETTRVELQ
ncbi:MAG: hypothetical protein AAF957_15275 [Planctomycetota bacterium]